MVFNIHDKMSELSEAELGRVDEVRQMQIKFGMEPRDDSILTYRYAIGDVPDYLNSSESVAKELVIVDYIFKNSNYGQIIEEVMREVAGFIHFKHKLDWVSAWDITRFYVPDMLKMYMIKKHGIDINYAVSSES